MSFEHLTRRYPDHECCWEERDLAICSSCGIIYKIQSNFGRHDLGEDRSRKDIFNINEDYYFTDKDVHHECMNISIYTTENYSHKIIDIWRVNCLSLPLGQNYTVRSELGQFKNMEASFDLWWECVGYAGPNCAKECNPNSRSYCDINGELKCKDGFINPPSCQLNSPCTSSPCKNGGICEAQSTQQYTCECPRAYVGRNCDELRCIPSKCAGECNNGDCVCTSENIDPSCNSFKCDGNFLCRNNGTCGAIDGEIFCVCPPNTFGAYCQYYCEPHCINGRCGGDATGNSVCHCFSDYIGDACETKLDTGIQKKNTDGLSITSKVTIALSVIFIIITICLSIKIAYDKYNADLMRKLSKKQSNHEADIKDITKP